MSRAALTFAAMLACTATSAAPFDPFKAAGIDRRDGAAVPMDLPFLDQTGKATTLGAIAAGRPLLLVPVLHDCPNICGVTLSGLAQSVAALGLEPGRDFEWVSFGIDPAEGPKQASASVAELAGRFPGHAGRIHALTGKAGAVHAVTEGLGYRYAWDPAIGQYAHVAATAVLTKDGRLARWLYGVAPSPEDLRLALTEAGEGSVGSWADQLLLLCYHYDPKTGAYGSTVWTMLRIGGGATAATGLFLIGIALLRERRRADRPS
jgi:protein SCO1/2